MEKQEIYIDDENIIYGNIIFRIPFTIYFICSVRVDSKMFLCLVRKKFRCGNYYWFLP
jgi:hypothetical protein